MASHTPPLKKQDAGQAKKGKEADDICHGSQKNTRRDRRIHPGPRQIGHASDEDMRAVGLSRQKIRYARALVDARIDYKGLRDLPDVEVQAVLTEVSGIGPWTAEIYAMFSLGRADVFAPGDLALQEAARMLFDLPERPKERDFRVMAQDWSPWASVAARLLWAYYRVAKDREGVSG